MATLRGSIQTLTQRAKAKSLRAATDVLRRGADRLVLEAKNVWPVASGFSKGRLYVRLRAGRKVAILGKAEYTRRIVSRGVRAWSTYVVEPVRRYASSEAPREMGRAIVQALAVKNGR